MAALRLPPAVLRAGAPKVVHGRLSVGRDCVRALESARVSARAHVVLPASPPSSHLPSLHPTPRPLLSLPTPCVFSRRGPAVGTRRLSLGAAPTRHVNIDTCQIFLSSPDVRAPAGGAAQVVHHASASLHNAPLLVPSPAHDNSHPSLATVPRPSRTQRS